MTALLLALILALTGIVRAESPALDALAELRAHEIAIDGFDHRYLDELNNGEWASWGEVIGWNTGFSDPAASIVNGWNQSGEHHVVLWNPDYTAIGCGSEQSGTDWYFVCILAVPAGTIPNTAMASERDLELIIAILLLVLLIVFVRRRR